jgi:hypothetical protein
MLFRPGRAADAPTRSDPEPRPATAKPATPPIDAQVPSGLATATFGSG